MSLHIIVMVCTHEASSSDDTLLLLTYRASAAARRRWPRSRRCPGRPPTPAPHTPPTAEAVRHTDACYNRRPALCVCWHA